VSKFTRQNLDRRDNSKGGSAVKKSEIVANVEAALAGLGVEDSANLAKLLVRNRICACDCDSCRKERASFTLTADAREVVKSWRDHNSGKTVVLEVDGAWVWVDNVSVRQDSTKGMASVLIDYSFAISSRGLGVFGENSLKLSYNGAWLSGAYPHQERQVAVVDPNDVRELPDQVLVLCPLCGRIGSSWEKTEDGNFKPHCILRIDGEEMTICNSCRGEFKPGDAVLLPAPSSISAGSDPWVANGGE